MNNMPVNESDQLVATQLAYAHLNTAVTEIIQKRSMQAKSDPVTVGEALEYALNNDVQLFSETQRFFSLDENGKIKYKDGYEHIANWEILSAVDDKGNTGFAACILDTGNARILSCRGSESMENLIHLKEDWVEADLMLLNSEMTKQEGALANYLRDNAELLSEKPWVSTGHSLGGALADFAAVMSVELTDCNGNKIGIDNYSGTINFDGPNHSFEFQKKYKDAIAAVSPYMEHQIASIVGDLLPKLPGVKTDYIITQDVGLLDKHGTENWVTSNGATIKGGTQSLEGYLVEKLSVGMDRLPAPLGNLIPALALTIVNGIIWIKDFSDKNPELAKSLVDAAALFLISNPAVAILAAKSIAAIVVFVTSILVIAFVGELIIEVFAALAQYIAEKICEFVDWLSDKVTEFFEAVSDLINDVKEWFRQQFNKGAKYAKEHPYFKVDTDMLYHYAARLQRVNSRLSSLDSSMRSLYWQVGFLDLWDILCANVLTCESYSLNKARNYLMDTAQRLSMADSKAKGYLGG